VLYTAVLLLILTQLRRVTSCCKPQQQQHSSSSSSLQPTLEQQQQDELLKQQQQQQQQQSEQQHRLGQLPPPAFSGAHSLSFGSSPFLANGLANGSSSAFANTNGSTNLPHAANSNSPSPAAAAVNASPEDHMLSPASSVSPFVAHGRSMVLTAPLASIGSELNDVLPPLDQTANHSSARMQLSSGVPGPVADSPFAFVLPAYESTSYISTSGSAKSASVPAAAAALAAARRRRGCVWLRVLWLLLAPQLHNTWALLASLAVAAMAYCYTLFSSVVVSAFSCMPLAGKPAVPGEVHLTARVWVPDMQLQCYTGQHMGVAAMAAFLGIPMLAAYWLLLIVLAMPQKGKAAGAAAANEESSTQPAAAGSAAAAAAAQFPVPSGPHRSAVAAAAAAQSAWQGMAAPPSRWQRLKACWQQCMLAPLRRLLAGLLRPFWMLAAACQRLTAGKGVDGSRCVGLDVWNQEHRWWWNALRECVKLLVLITVVVNSMHASYVQAPLVLLMVLLTAVLIWKLQPGCSTSMNWLLYIMYCLWAVLALLVLFLAVAGVNAAAFGGVLLAMLCVVMANAYVTLGSLVWRCAEAVAPSAQPLPHPQPL
jgi:hypothetical protein